jgi:hypothetical protein
VIVTARRLRLESDMPSQAAQRRRLACTWISQDRHMPSTCQEIKLVKRVTTHSKSASNTQEGEFHRPCVCRSTWQGMGVLSP